MIMPEIWVDSDKRKKEKPNMPMLSFDHSPEGAVSVAVVDNIGHHIATLSHIGNLGNWRSQCLSGAEAVIAGEGYNTEWAIWGADGKFIKLA